MKFHHFNYVKDVLRSALHANLILYVVLVYRETEIIQIFVLVTMGISRIIIMHVKNATVAVKHV